MNEEYKKCITERVFLERLSDTLDEIAKDVTLREDQLRVGMLAVKYTIFGRLSSMEESK